MKTRERKKKNDEFKNEHIHFVMPKTLKEEFLKLCEKNGFSYGKRIRVLVKADLEGKIKI